MKPFTRSIGWVGLVALWFALSGCLIGYDPDSVELQEAGDGTPRVVVTSPRPDDQVGDQLRIRLSLSNFSLVEPTGQENNDHEGHLSILIDGASILGDDPITRSSIDVVVRALAEESPTEHTLDIVVHNNDGSTHNVIQPISITWVKLPNT